MELHKKRSLRPYLIALGLVLAGLAAAVVALWFTAEARLRDGLSRWSEAQRADGWQLAYEDGPTSGFPFTVRMSLTRPRLMVPPEPAKGVARLFGFAAESESLHLVWSLFDPFAVKLSLPSRASMDVTWPNGGKWQGVLAGGGSILLAPGSEGNGRLVLWLDRPWLTATGQGADVSAARLRLELLRHAVQSTDHLQPSLDIDLSLTELLAPDADPILAKPMDLNLRATLMGALPPGPPAQVVPAWRDAGGTLEFHELRVASGAVRLTGNATLALDRQMRPQAAGTLTAVGFPEAIDRLMEAHIIEARDGKLAKLLLLALARKDEETGQPSLSVPVTVQNGWLSVGPSQLLAVKPLRL
jgi:hypothetical protein